MEKKYLLIGIFSFVVFLSLFFALGVLSVSNPQTVIGASSANDGIAYHSSVCTDVLRIDGTREQLGCSHNNLTNTGRNAIETMLASANPSATPGNFTFIGLGNSTAVFTVSDANTSLDNLYNDTSGAGLNISAGTYASHASAGNWSIYKTFTAATNNLKANVTGLFNGTSSGPLDSQNATMFAWNRFTDVTLQSGDQLTVNWTVWVA